MVAAGTREGGGEELSDTGLGVSEVEWTESADGWAGTGRGKVEFIMTHKTLLLSNGERWS